jgi:asparagine synthase (glutamine-hydrolysing)
MPGLLGIALPADNDTEASHCFDGMLAAMNRGGRLVAETRKDKNGRWALGRVHLGVLQPAPQLKGNDGLHVLFHGELTNEPSLNEVLAKRGQPPAPDTASLVAALYRTHRRTVGGLLQGSFCAAIFDEADGALLLLTDRLGNYPLYWFKTRDRFVFASELRAVLRAHPKPTLNPAAVADVLKFAFPIGDKTLAAGVELVPTGSTLFYCARTHNVEVEIYANVADLFRRSDVTRAEYMRDIQAASVQAMDSAVHGSHRFGLSLSGGLDTRVILSAMDRLGRSKGAATFTLGGRGCADEVIGYQLARMANTEHQFVALDDHYLDDLLPTVSRMVSLTDGMYLSHGFTEMLALQGFEGSDCSVLLRGHAGELAKASTAWPLHTDRQLFSMQSNETFVPYMMARTTHVSRGDAARQVLSDRAVEELNGASAEQSLRDCVAGVPLAAADLCSYVYLKEYHRRVTVPSLEIFRNVAEIRLPLADVRFLGAVLRGPAEWRDGVGIHQMLIRANRANYLRVRNPNTGAPAGAGPLLEAVLDKMNSALRRLNVYGYRHYHAFDGWMRRTLLDIVDKVVLDRDTLARGVMRTEAVRRMAAEARSGVKDHDDLLQALVIVELWQREMAVN